MIVACATLAQASNTGQDNASNMPYQPSDTWNSGDNGGIGFAGWSFANTVPTNGFAGEYVGGTGDGTPAFGLFASHNGDSGSTSDATATASRSFTGGGMTPGQTFSMTLGIGGGVDNGGVLGFNLLSGSTPEFTFKFTGGQSVWQLNNGGSDFNTTIPFSNTTPISFAFTYDGGNNYNLLVTEGATTYTATGLRPPTTSPISMALSFLIPVRAQATTLGSTSCRVPSLQPGSRAAW